MSHHKSRGTYTYASLFCVLITTGLSVYLSTVFSRVQPEPYMDEVFHVRQTMAYVHGNWTQWDPKITTPPGTYVLFCIFHQLLELVQLVQTPTLCEFRCFNALLCGINHLVMLAVVQQLQQLDRAPMLTSLVIVTNPVLFFFSALYYTDQCAVLFTLLMIYFSLKPRARLSALFGAFGIIVRQTNVVWLLVSVCILSGHRLASVYGFSFSRSSALPAATWLNQMLRKTMRQPKLLCHAVVQVLHSAPIHFLVIGLFLLFIRWNGGIVLGDRSAHQAVIHVCQLWYFVVFCTILTPCGAVKFFIDRVRVCVRRTKTGQLVLRVNELGKLLLLLTGILLSLRYASFAHPYLLADNRHYTFYVWRKLIYRSRFTFYALSGIYAACSVYWLDRLFGSALSFSRWLTDVAIILGTVCSLIPAGLLEPRYFIIPYTLWRLFCTQTDGFRPPWQRIAEVCVNLVVILVVSYIFCMKPFYWNQEPGVIQRFMW